MQIVDGNLFRQLIYTFYSNAVREIENIRKKMENDQKFQIQLTEKALQ
jgi:hypothetical protein